MSCWMALTILMVMPAAINGQRIPQNAVPIHYDISLTPDIESAKFSGSERIEVVLAQPANSITLNAVDITFLTVSAQAGNALPIAGEVSLAPEKEQATLVFPAELPAGKVKLTIQYSGVMNDEPLGFYRFKSGVHNYASTSLEATNARRAFPSFDEPALKATFDIALTIDAGDMAISNSAVISDQPVLPVSGAARHTVRFDTTPKLSTYLVAFLVGDFECISGESDKTTLRVCTLPGKSETGRIALSTAEYVLHDYNERFGIRYPLPKLDLIALPELKSAGLENFGAITFRETSLLVDGKSASLDQKKEVALTVAHEVAHQWFGDLVTMQWWDNLWLNEGLATWISSKTMARLHPDWHFAEDDAETLDQSLSLDSQRTTHAIRTKADTPSEIAEMFDGIAYGKSAAMLRMVEEYVGEKTFMLGVHNYLVAHAYGNAAADDFWNAQVAASKKPVDRIMSSLVDLPGVPLLSFKANKNGYVEVTQRRFFSDLSGDRETSAHWSLAVCFRTSVHPVCVLMDASDQEVRVPASTLLFANAGGVSFFRSYYQGPIYRSLLAHAASSLRPEERIVMIGDELALMRAGMASVADNLDMVAAISAESNPAILQKALDAVQIIENQIATDQDRQKLEAWVRKQFLPAYLALGAAPAAINSESQEKRLLRSVLFLALGEAKYPAVLAEARKLSENFIADQASVEPSLAAASLYLAATNGDAGLYDQLVALRRSSADPEVQSTALFLTTHFSDPALLKRTLDSITSGKSPGHNNGTMLAILLRNRETQPQTWTYVTEHWASVEPIAGPRLVAAAGTFCSAESHDEVLNFFNLHEVRGAERALKETAESISACAALRLLQEPKLKDWLSTR